MDVKNEIEKAVAKITGSPASIEKFKKDPVAAVKAVLGNDIARDVIDKVIAAVKAKLGADSAGAIAKQASDALGGLFGKK